MSKSEGEEGRVSVCIKVLARAHLCTCVHTYACRHVCVCVCMTKYIVNVLFVYECVVGESRHLITKEQQNALELQIKINQNKNEC